MKLKTLVDNRKVLSTLADLSLPAQKAWELADSVDEAMKAIKRYDEKRDSLVHKHGELVEGGEGQYSIKNLQPFLKELKGVEGVDLEIKFPPITLEQLNGDEITPREIISMRELGLFIKAKQDDSKKA